MSAVADIDIMMGGVGKSVAGLVWQVIINDPACLTAGMPTNHYYM